MNSIQVVQQAKKTKNTKRIKQTVIDFITLKVVRDIFTMDFNFELTPEDLREIDEQLWA